jgi:hypothetical protein
VDDVFIAPGSSLEPFVIATAMADGQISGLVDTYRDKAARRSVHTHHRLAISRTCGSATATSA